MRPRLALVAPLALALVLTATPAAHADSGTDRPVLIRACNFIDSPGDWKTYVTFATDDAKHYDVTITVNVPSFGPDSQTVFGREVFPIWPQFAPNKGTVNIQPDQFDPHDTRQFPLGATVTAAGATVPIVSETTAAPACV